MPPALRRTEMTSDERHSLLGDGRSPPEAGVERCCLVLGPGRVGDSAKIAWSRKFNFLVKIRRPSRWLQNPQCFSAHPRHTSQRPPKGSRPQGNPRRLHCESPTILFTEPAQILFSDSALKPTRELNLIPSDCSLA